VNRCEQEVPLCLPRTTFEDVLAELKAMPEFMEAWAEEVIVTGDQVMDDYRMRLWAWVYVWAPMQGWTYGEWLQAQRFIISEVIHEPA